MKKKKKRTVRGRNGIAKAMRTPGSPFTKRIQEQAYRKQMRRVNIHEELHEND